MKKKMSLALSTLFLASSLPALAAPSIQFKLNGKTIQSVPLDQLGKVQVEVNSGGPSFKSLWSGQWKGIDQALNIVTTAYPKGQSAPDLQSSSKWNGFALTRSNYDSSWAGQKKASTDFRKSGIPLDLFRATDKDDLMFTTRFRRQVYTGKTVWKDGGYVKETRWETVGPPKGQAKLKLMPPTFASSLVPEQVFESTLAALNKTPKNQYTDNRAMFLSRTLLYPTSYGGREVKFTGSKATGFESTGGQPVFNWNLVDGKEYVYAKFPVNMKLHAVMITKYEALPTPMTVEADFLCPIKMEVRREVGSKQWVGRDVEFNSEIRSACKTPDGKTPEEVAKSVGDPLKNLTMPDPNSSQLDQAKDILNQIGF